MDLLLEVIDKYNQWVERKSKYWKEWLEFFKGFETDRIQIKARKGILPNIDFNEWRREEIPSRTFQCDWDVVEFIEGQGEAIYYYKTRTLLKIKAEVWYAPVDDSDTIEIKDMTIYNSPVWDVTVNSTTEYKEYGGKIFYKNDSGEIMVYDQAIQIFPHRIFDSYVTLNKR